MSVESFDPSAANAALSDDDVETLCRLAPANDDIDLADGDVAKFSAASKHEGWAEKATALDDADLEGLIRLFTMGGEKYPSWAAGAKSPVIALVRELKSRGTYRPELTSWIKAHTTNKFLPHGSLMDRL